MPIIESESLILRSYPLAEADKIVVFLTPEHGLLRGVAKGAKRLSSRFGGNLEPFSVVNLTYFQKEERELVSISASELHRSYFSEAGNPDFVAKCSYFCDMIVQFVPPGAPDDRVYRMARVTIEAAAANVPHLELVELYFDVWLLRLAGFLPNWRQCGRCKREFERDEAGILQLDFQLQCRPCSAGLSRNQIEPEERNVVLSALNANPTQYVEIHTEKKTHLENVSQILRKIIFHILGRNDVRDRGRFVEERR